MEAISTMPIQRLALKQEKIFFLHIFYLFML